MLKAVSCSWLHEQQKFGTQAEDVLFAYQKISCLAVMVGILGTLTDKGQNRLYGGEDKDILFAGVNDRLFGEKATISCSLAGGEYLNRRDGKDLFVIAANPDC